MNKSQFCSEDWFWAEIATGITIGVTVAAIAAFFQLGVKLHRIQKQKKRIRKLISTSVTDIRKAKPLVTSLGFVALSVDQERKITYQSLWRVIDIELSHKLSEISFDDEQKIRNAFLVLNHICQKDEEPDIGMYKDYLFEPLKKVKWLKLE